MRHGLSSPCCCFYCCHCCLWCWITVSAAFAAPVVVVERWWCQCLIELEVV